MGGAGSRFGTSRHTTSLMTWSRPSSSLLMSLMLRDDVGMEVEDDVDVGGDDAVPGRSCDVVVDVGDADVNANVPVSAAIRLSISLHSHSGAVAISTSHGARPSDHS